MTVAISILSSAVPRGLLNEGPFAAADGSLLWVDILSKAVFRHELQTGLISRFDAPEKVSSAIECVDGSILATGERILWRLNVRTGVFSAAYELRDERPGNRCNDAKTDPFGNLWFGTMDDAEIEASGVLWCLTVDGRLMRMQEGIGVSNTLAWDLSRNRMYFADSKQDAIYVFALRYEGGVPILGPRRIFVGPGAAPGVPDGSAIDANGSLWNARWDGGCVICFDPDGRELDRIDIGATRPTSCAFSGADLRLLAVTTASCGLDNPGSHDGRVLVLKAPVQGQPVPTAKVLLQGVGGTAC